MEKNFKNFRMTLNNWYNGMTYKNHIYGQRKRGYGDYIYFQDKERFLVLFNLWNVTDTKQEFEAKG